MIKSQRSGEAEDKVTHGCLEIFNTCSMLLDHPVRPDCAVLLADSVPCLVLVRSKSS